MYKRKKIIVLIPARGGSKGIPRKNIRPLLGKPLIAWTIEQALGSDYIDEVYVTTEDKEIADISDKYGAKVIKRPSELAADTSSSEAALQHAVSMIEKNKKIDIVVFLQATSPVRESKDINEAIEKFSSEDADSLFSAAVLESCCIWEIADNKPRSITYDYRKRPRRQDRQPCYFENGSIYIFKPEIIKQYNNRLGGKIIVYPMPSWKSYDIDSPEDIEICEYFLKNKISGKAHNLLLRNIKLIVYDFDGVLTDNKVILREDGLEVVKVNRSDGLAISKLKASGIEQIILTTETNKVSKTRADKLGIPIITGIKDKKSALVSYCKKNSIPLDEVVYIGNDLNDFEAMQAAGWPICPADACKEIKSISRIILNAKGGSGAARELLSYL